MHKFTKEVVEVETREYFEELNKAIEEDRIKRLQHICKFGKMCVAILWVDLAPVDWSGNQQAQFHEQLIILIVFCLRQNKNLPRKPLSRQTECLHIKWRHSKNYLFNNTILPISGIFK